MKEAFEAPRLEVCCFTAEEILTASVPAFPTAPTDPWEGERDDFLR